MIISVIVPSNLFVYGTSDTQYTENVSSTVEISDIEIGDEIVEDSVTDNSINSNVAEVLNIEYTKDDVEYIVYGKELLQYDIAVQTADAEVTEVFDNLTSVEVDELSNYDVTQVDNIGCSIEDDTESLVALQDIEVYSGPSNNYKVIDNLKEEECVEVTNIQKDGFSLLYNKDSNAWVETEMIGDVSEILKHKQGTALLDIDIPDVDYEGTVVELTPEDRELCERLVQGEAGNQGYEGAALVAQAIRDAMVYKGYDSVEQVRACMGYTGSISKEPNKDVKDAVSYIFDDGGYAVRHKVLYFYSYNATKSSWHESQQFIIQYKGHRFFSSHN